MPLFKKHKLARAISTTLPLVIFLSLSGCGDDNFDPDAINAPDIYEFPSSISLSENSADYQEATTRWLLIYELQFLIESSYLQEYGQNNTEADVKELLNRIYELGTGSNINSLANSNIYGEPIGATPLKGINSSKELPLEHSTYDQLENSVNLKDKMPGIDYELLYEDGFKNPAFIGWSFTDGSSETNYPNKLVNLCFSKIAELAIDMGEDANNTKFIDGAIDYKALLISFLISSITYAQVSNIHLNTGINSNHSELLPGKKFTDLEHNWDLAFGYYGTSKYIKQLSSNQITSTADFNYVGSTLDPLTEYNFSTVIESEKRDQAMTLLSSNYTGNTIDAFFNGRKIISDETLSNNYNYKVYADKIIENWEKSLLATVIHEINNTLYNLNKYSAYPSVFVGDYASSWSKLKGLALGLQFNPHSSLSEDDLRTLHNKLGTKPKHYTELEIPNVEDRSILEDYYRDLEDAAYLIRDQVFPGEDTYNW